MQSDGPLASHAHKPQTSSAVSPAPKSALFQLLPSVDEVLRSRQIERLAQSEGRSATLEAARAELDELRAEIDAGELDEARISSKIDRLPHAVEQRLKESHAYSLRPVINATGVILHTNLGRAPLSRSALEHAGEVSRGYSNLEFDLVTGERGKRDVHVDRLFAKLLNTAEREGLDHRGQQQCRCGAAGA